MMFQLCFCDSEILEKWSWQFGIILSLIYGLFFTVNKFLIQYYTIDAIEMLLLRSIMQVITIGLIAVIRRSRKAIIDQFD